MRDIPIQFVVMTYNLWAYDRWPERADSLRSFLKSNTPDILGVQELRPETQKLLDDVLIEHQRVDDAFPGWTHEGNIYWHSAMFELVGFGSEEIGILEELRRLFWVRLRCVLAPERTILVATAHYTQPGAPAEYEGGINPRHEQANRTVDALARLVQDDEPVLFMGDLNDFFHPLRILREAGLRDCFAGLQQTPKPTHPAMPTARSNYPLMPWDTPKVYDWLMHRGPIKPKTCAVVDYFYGDLAPSDHKPVVATYALLSRT